MSKIRSLSRSDALTTDALTQAGLNLIGQALSIYDADLRLAVCNNRFAEMFDLPENLVTAGATFEETIRHLAMRGEYGPVEDLDAFVAPRVAQASAFEPHYLERRRANGRWISVEGAPLEQGGWVTVYTDITATRAQEELLRTRSEALSEEVLRRSEELSQTNRELAATVSALEETQRQLRRSEARTRLTTEMMPAHIAHVDARGHYTYSNRRLSSVIPDRPSEIIGLHISEALGPSAWSKVHPHHDAAQSGKPSVFEFTEEPSQRRIRVAFTPDPAGAGTYILSMDITDETRTRAALQHTRRRETAARLVSGMAHDFSNLLTIILGMQSKLAGLPDLPDAATPLIAATRSAAERGGDLLSRIGDMTGARNWRPKRVELAKLLQDVETFSRPSLPDGMALKVDCDVSAPQYLDAGLLQDALLNLILNARDACGENGALSLTAEQQGDWLTLTMDDTGPGFSDEALTHAVEPFYSTKGGEGTGLGLVMVYDMVKLAGGDMRISNTAQGARVRLRLPMPSLNETPSGLILLVEDSDDLREAVRDMLTDMGHSVIEARRVREAIELARDVPGITAVLSDIVLAGARTGVDLAAALSPLPVTLMTSLPANDPRRASAEARGQVLSKPFTADTLAHALSRTQ